VRQDGYDWTVRPADWPPRGRPTPPLGPTELEVVRACPLRACFEASPTYERRLAFEARLGIAFHRVLESITRQPPRGGDPEVVDEVRRCFQAALREQLAVAEARPRERALPRDLKRLPRAEEALVLLGLRLRDAAGPLLARTPAPAPEIEVEVALVSRDGLLAGRVDLVEHGPGGAQLVDYKASLRPDLPEQYRRQVLLYALLWWECRGEWPQRAVVAYPLLETTHAVDVVPDECRRLGQEARELLGLLQQASSPASLARPGTCCQACDFRPWCEPFWGWQHAESRPSARLERASWGMEVWVEDAVPDADHLRLQLAWGRDPVQLIVPLERYPHLRDVSRGARLRLLDVRLRGLRHRPTAALTERTEIFLVDADGRGA